MTNTRMVVALSMSLVSLAACGGSSAAPLHEPDAGPLAIAADGDDDFKGCPDGIPKFEPGLQALGEHVRVKLLAAMPAEPERNLNRWTVELESLDGSPAPDAQIVRGETFMPIHGHDGRVQPQMMALPEPGRIEVDRLNFSMRGPWEVHFWLRSESQEDDYVVFTVCVAK